MINTIIDISLGILIGIFIGYLFGIIIWNNQKPWSELTEEEKRSRKILIGTGIIILIFGIITFVWSFFYDYF
jgi:hypothetical protein